MRLVIFVVSRWQTTVHRRNIQDGFVIRRRVTKFWIIHYWDQHITHDTSIELFDMNPILSDLVIKIV